MNCVTFSHGPRKRRKKTKQDDDDNNKNPGGNIRVFNRFRQTLSKFFFFLEFRPCITGTKTEEEKKPNPMCTSVKE